MFLALFGSRVFSAVFKLFLVFFVSYFYNDNALIFSQAWSLYLFVIPFICFGFIDYFFRRDSSNGDRGGNYFRITVYCMTAFFAISLFIYSILSFFYESYSNSIFAILVVYAYCQSLLICFERYFQIHNKIKELMKLQLFINASSFLLCLLFFINEWSLSYLLILITIFTLLPLIYLYHKDELEQVTPSYSVFKEVIRGSISFGLISLAYIILSRGEQLIFSFFADENFASYFLAARFTDVTYFMMAIFSQINLGRNYQEGRELRLSNYVVFSSLSIISTILITKIGIHIFNVENVDFLEVLIFLLPSVIIKSAVTFFSDKLFSMKKESSLARSLFILVIFSLSTNAILIWNFSVNGALAGLYLSLFGQLIITYLLVRRSGKHVA